MKRTALFFHVLLSICLLKSGLAQVVFTESIHVDDDSSLATNQWQSHAALGPGGVVCVVWSNESAGDGDILFSQKGPADSVFSLPIRVDDGPAGTAQGEPRIATNGEGDVFVAWTDARGGNRDIRFARKSAGEEVFGPSVSAVLDTSGADQFDPVIAAKGDSIVIAWEDLRNSEPDIYCAYSTDGGETFTSNVMVNDFLPGVEQHAPDAAVDSQGTLYVVWEDKRSGSPEIYIARNENWSGPFSAGVLVYDTAALEQRAPSIAAGPGDCVDVVWWDSVFLTESVRHSRSCDGGGTFSPPEYVYSSWFVDQYQTDIFVDDRGIIHLCYNEVEDIALEQCYGTLGPIERLAYAASSDSGETFESFDITDTGGYRPLSIRYAAVLPAADGRVSLVWSDTRSGNSMSDEALEPFGYDVYYNTIEEGTVIGRAVRVNPDPLPYDHAFPAVAWSPEGKVYVCWSDERSGNARIFCTVSTDSGETCGPSVLVAEPSVGREQAWPCIDTSPSGEVHITWFERNDEGIGAILFAESSDIYSGFSDPVPVTDSLDLEVLSRHEMITDAGGIVNVVWADTRDDEGDIFFSRSIDGGLTFSQNSKVNADQSGAKQMQPYFAVDGEGDLYAVWIHEVEYDYDVYFARTHGGNGEFQGELQVTTPSSPRDNYEPTVGVDGGGKIYVMWASVSSLFISTSTDGGESFLEPREVAASHVGNGQRAEMQLYQEKLHFMWNPQVNGDWCVWFEVLHMMSTDGGETFSDAIFVNDDTTHYANYPDYDLDARGDLAVVWADPRQRAYTLLNPQEGPDRTLDNIFLSRGTVTLGIDENEDLEMIPRSYMLFQNFPNPFNPQTTIPFDIPEGVGPGIRTRLRVYNLRGELVRELIDLVLAPGRHRVVWDGRSRKGFPAGSGVYFARIEAGEFRSVRKMLLLR